MKTKYPSMIGWLYDGWHFLWISKPVRITLDHDQLAVKLRKTGVKRKDIPQCVEQIKARRARLPLRNSAQAAFYRRSVSFFD